MSSVLDKQVFLLITFTILTIVNNALAERKLYFYNIFNIIANNYIYCVKLLSKISGN